MKHYCLLLFLNFYVLFTYSQDWYLVEDKDGYVNVRDAGNKVTDRLSSGRPVWNYEDKNDMMNVEYTKGGIYTSGYIHKSRLKKLSSYQKISKIRETPDSIIFRNDSTDIIITKKKFIKGNRIFGFYDDNILEEIDNNRIWGTDGMIPKEEYDSFKISFRNKEIILPYFAYFDLFEPNLGYTDIYLNEANNTLFIT